MKSILIFLPFFICQEFLKKQVKKVEDNVYTDGVDYRIYKKVILPDTSKCEFFRLKRGVVAIFKDKKVVVESDMGNRYLKIDKDFRLAVCNLPKEIYKAKIGDTIAISGKAYNVAGNEKFIGNPTILYKIRLKN